MDDCSIGNELVDNGDELEEIDTGGDDAELREDSFILFDANEVDEFHASNVFN